MKEYNQIGAYGILIKDNQILLIKKVGGPFDGKLDLPGGTIEFYEKPEDTLKREFLEKENVLVKEYKLLDTDSFSFDWQYKDDAMVKVYYTGAFYLITNYEVNNLANNSILKDFYDINILNRNNLSPIAILELEKLGYKF